MEYYRNTFSSKNFILSVSGIIGAGKSTLSTKLGKELKATVLYEPVNENKYLEKFYNDKRKYSFPMQIFLLNKRFKQHQQMVWSDKNTIQDRSIYEDVIFANMLRKSKMMEELDFQTYLSLFKNMSNFLNIPDLIIYLDVKPKIALERIKNRSRNCETNINLEYLNNLQKGYEDWLKDISQRIPVLKIDWDKFKDIEYVINLVKNKLKEIKKV